MRTKSFFLSIIVMTTLLAGIISPLRCQLTTSIPSIGQWREHLNYRQTIQVVPGDKIYCATPYAVFSIDEQNETERYSKISGLNDIGVQCIGWDALTGQLVVAYTNSNLDVLKGSSTKNIGDIKRSTVAGNKTLNHIFCKDGLAYLSSGLGVIVANLTKYEIKDTWYIGNAGGQVKVNAFTADAQRFYAATEEGLKSIPQNGSNPSNFTEWKQMSGVAGLTDGPVKNVVTVNNTIIAEKNDSLFVLNGNSWSILYADKTWPILSTTSSENRILVCQRTPAGSARVIQLNTSGQIEKTITQNNIISYPRSAVMQNSAVWLADQFGGLSRFDNNGSVQFIPEGPLGTADGEMLFSSDHLYAAAGSVNAAWNYQYNRNGLFDFINDKWNYTGYYNTPQFDSVLDIITVAADPDNNIVWAGSYGGGLVELKEGNNPVIYKKANSSLQPAIGDPGSFRVSGLALDKNNNLWVSNYGAAQNLHVRKKDGSWKGFTPPFALLENATGQLVVDDYGQVWIVSPKNNGLLCYNPGASIDNTADDQWKFYQQGLGNGNLPANNVLCIAKDKNGFIWAGTDKGIGIIQCTNSIFSGQGCDASLPIVQNDRFAGLLFKDEYVQCIAVDGANRKWIGTKNGAWLVSPDGDKVIYRFTAENSALLANDVKRIAVNPLSGEVFFSTVYGICSFRSTATEGMTDNNNVLVFPNPVPPGYNGSIAIRGLTENALVKITELSGRLVYQTRALGGQAVWNGTDYKGGKAASGVYLVIVRDDTGNEKKVTSIVLTSGR